MSGEPPVEDSWSFAGDVLDAAAATPVEESAELLRTTSREPRPGERFGAFEVVSRLGRGGMGVVFLARDASSRRAVALKILSARRLNKRQRDRFRREGELTATLNHPSIVRIHSGGEVGGLPFLAYELVEGGKTLEDVLEDLEVLDLLRMVQRVAAAVGYAHSLGVVHRDLKPENVLIDRGGNPRVADFGLAWCEGQDRLTRTGAMVGTPAFMAPEQFDSGLGDVGPWTDVWALGVTLFRGLTGRPPFVASSLVELASKVTHGHAISPRDLNGAVSKDLEAICLKALARAPAERYPDGTALSDDLTRAIAGDPVSASAVRWRWAQRRRSLRRVGWVGAAVVLIAALFVVLEPHGSRAGREAEIARLLSGFRRGQRSRVELRAILESPEGIAPSTRYALHMALAAGPGSAPDESRERARHADEALALAGTDDERSHAHRAAGDALLALGQYGAADDHFSNAWALTGDADAVLLTGKARRLAGRLEGAEEAAERYLQERPDAPEGLELLARLQVDGGRIGAARATAKRCVMANPGPRSYILLAEVMEASGEDIRPLLEGRLRDWPDHPGLRLALAEHLLLVRGDALGAAGLAFGPAAEARDGDDDAQRLAQLGACLSDVGCGRRLGAHPDLERLARAPRPWRVACGAWLLEEARRELAFVERTRDPYVVRDRSAVSVDERRARVKRALNALGTLQDVGLEGPIAVAWARLEGVDTEAGRVHVVRARELMPADPEVALLDAEGLLAAGDPRSAERRLEHLTRGVGVPETRLRLARARAALALGDWARAADLARGVQPWALDVRALEVLAQALDGRGLSAEAQGARERIRLLRFRPRAQEAIELEGRNSPGSKNPPHEHRAFYRKLVAMDPGSVTWRYEWGKAEYKMGERREGLRALAWCISRDPSMLADFMRDVLVIAHSSGFYTTDNITLLLEQIGPFTDDLEDLVVEALLSVGVVEFNRLSEWSDRALRAVEAVVAEDAGNPVGWIARGFLHVRAGRFDRARRDLDIAAEEAPNCSMRVFYEVLLAAARGKPFEARQKLEELDAMSFPPPHDNAWVRQFYPEVAPYADDPGFELFRAQHDRRQ